MIIYLFGKNILVIQCAQIILNIASGALLFTIAHNILPRSAKCVFALFMISPFEALCTGALLSEALASFLLIVLTYCISCIQGIKKWIFSALIYLLLNCFENRYSQPILA